MTDMLQFLYRIHPTRPAMLADGPTSAEEAIIDKHFAYLKDLTERGVVVIAARTLTTGPDSFGICILEAESEAAARDIMNNDPAVKQGVMRAEFFPCRVALLRNPS